MNKQTLADNIENLKNKVRLLVNTQATALIVKWTPGTGIVYTIDQLVKTECPDRKPLVIIEAEHFDAFSMMSALRAHADDLIVMYVGAENFKDLHTLSLLKGACDVGTDRHMFYKRGGIADISFDFNGKLILMSNAEVPALLDNRCMKINVQI